MCIGIDFVICRSCVQLGVKGTRDDYTDDDEDDDNDAAAAANNDNNDVINSIVMKIV